MSNNQCKNCKNVLGIFPLEPHYETFKVSSKNAEIFFQFCLANGIQTRDKEEAKYLLLKRDHFKIHQLTNKPYEPGMVGAKFVPPTFMSKILVERGEMIGEMAERELYDGLKNYFGQTRDDCLILHGHNFLCGDNLKEKVIISVLRSSLT